MGELPFLAFASYTLRLIEPFTASTPQQMPSIRQTKFSVGDVVRHRFFPFRGLIFDIDPVFANTEEWWLAIPVEIRPHKDQPYYHIYAENAETVYVAYVSEQNLLADDSGEPLRHPDIADQFVRDAHGRYRSREKAH